MKDIFVLTLILCSNFHCTKEYEIYDTSIQCRVAETKWENSGGWWFAAGIRRGVCSRQKMTDEDIQLLKNVKR